MDHAEPWFWPVVAAALAFTMIATFIIGLWRAEVLNRRFKAANPLPLGVRWGDGSWTAPDGRIVADPIRDPEYQALRQASLDRLFGGKKSAVQPPQRHLATPEPEDPQ